MVAKIDTRRLPCATLAALAAALAGCGGTPPPVEGTRVLAPAATDAAAFSATPPADYRLRPSDTIAVTVFREPDLSLAATPVSADGLIDLPLVGALRVEGMTPREVAATITQALGRGYLQRPEVAVNVVSYGSHSVTVEGAVNRPGVYTFKPGARLSSAVAQAEGPTRVAKLDQVAVFRPTPQGMTVAKFDYAAMQQGTMIDPVLEPGDRVVIGTSGLSQFWQDTLKTLPVFALFTRF